MYERSKPPNASNDCLPQPRHERKKRFAPQVSHESVVLRHQGYRQARRPRGVCSRVQVAELRSRAALGSLGSWSPRCRIDLVSAHEEDGNDAADDDALLTAAGDERVLGDRVVAEIIGADAARPAGRDGGGIQPVC